MNILFFLTPKEDVAHVEEITVTQPFRCLAWKGNISVRSQKEIYYGF